jgi:hypothetical protein
MMAVLVAFMVVVSLLGRTAGITVAEIRYPEDDKLNGVAVQDAYARPVIALWGIIAFVMFIIYYIFR